MLCLVLAVTVLPCGVLVPSKVAVIASVGAFTVAAWFCIATFALNAVYSAMGSK